jgi:hypothetical protein
VLYFKSLESIIYSTGSLYFVIMTILNVSLEMTLISSSIPFDANILILHFPFRETERILKFPFITSKLDLVPFPVLLIIGFFI